MSHRSRLGVVVIDCETDDLSHPLAFWSAALGMEGEIDADGQYAVMEGYGEGYPGILLQRVTHAPRVHLDIETDDREAEAARLTALGAREVTRVKSWIVMEAPTGHRFCLVPPQRAGGMPPDAKAME